MTTAILGLGTILLGVLTFIAGYRAAKFSNQTLVILFIIACACLLILPIVQRRDLYGDPVIPTETASFIVGWSIGLVRKLLSMKARKIERQENKRPAKALRQRLPEESE
ncbi:hypothetical protein BH10CYA1_BH10CYA1_48470 [soil metagenome]